MDGFIGFVGIMGVDRFFFGEDKVLECLSDWKSDRRKNIGALLESGVGYGQHFRMFKYDFYMAMQYFFGWDTRDLLLPNL